MFPENDSQYEEHVLTAVEGDADSGWSIRHGGFGFYCPPGSPVTPAPGMTARFYGRGFGSRVRGLFLDGHKVFYRTPAEDDEHFEITLYGKDAAEWLSRWDAGQTVWTIEMGGLGPGYEQCIHITCAEILRVMLDKKYEHANWTDQNAWKRDRDEIEQAVLALPIIKDLGLSGAQWGAAIHIAANLYMRGPRAVMSDEQVKDRHIQVSNRMRIAA